MTNNNITNDNKQIAETLLTIWRDLPNYCEIISRKIHHNAVHSYTDPNSTIQIVDKIIDWTVQKDILQNLLNEMNAAIGGLPIQQQTALRNYYHDNKRKTATELSAEMGISVRSFYRGLDSAVNSFARKLPHIGVNAFTWADLTDNNPWIKNVYRSLWRSRRESNPD